MSSILEKKLDAICEANGGLSRLEVSIMCPLDSGITVAAYGIQDGRRIQPKVGGAKDFFEFVLDYRNRHPMERFNRITVIMENGAINQLQFTFDEALQKETLDNIQ